MRIGGWFSVGRQDCAECRDCGGLVFWRESKRTGKRYPAAVTAVNSENALRAQALVWVTHAPHKCPPKFDAVGAIVGQIAHRVETFDYALRMVHDGGGFWPGFRQSLSEDFAHEVEVEYAAILRKAYGDELVAQAFERYAAEGK